jgi:peroxiredoxin (alkyl hydroperoxide reductase subunit C)
MTTSTTQDGLLPRDAEGPVAYARRVRWLPQIGDLMPDFHAQSTRGPIRFHAWARGGWTILFSHYGAFSPVCTTELASFAACGPDFASRGVRMLGLSGSPVIEQLRWHRDIHEIYGVEVDYPVLADTDGRLARLLGMLHAEQSAPYAMRKTLILGPDLRIRMIQEYPIRVARSTEETLRVLDAIRTSEAYNVGTWADWQDGEDVLILPRQFGEARAEFGPAVRSVRPYLATAPNPDAAVAKG